MNIIISNANGEPIYEQIYNQICSAIVSGNLQQGEQLPSIRNLAKDLRISVITTKRAYEELENGGYIYSVPGKGSYVAEKNTEIIKEMHLKQIEEHIQEIIKLSSICGLSMNEIIEMMTVIAEEAI